MSVIEPQSSYSGSLNSFQLLLSALSIFIIRSTYHPFNKDIIIYQLHIYIYTHIFISSLQRSCQGNILLFGLLSISPCTHQLASLTLVMVFRKVFFSFIDQPNDLSFFFFALCFLLTNVPIATLQQSLSQFKSTLRLKRSSLLKYKTSCTLPRGAFMMILFDCLFGVIVPPEKFSLIWRCHHCR